MWPQVRNTPSDLMVCVVKMVDIWISLPGVLCGQCREPYGVGMLTMKCQEFTAKFPMYYWLMPLLSESSVHTLLGQSLGSVAGRGVQSDNVFSSSVKYESSLVATQKPCGFLKLHYTSC